MVNSRNDGVEDNLTNNTYNLSFQISNATGYSLSWDDDSITAFGGPATNAIYSESFDPNTGILTISGNPGAQKLRRILHLKHIIIQ